MKKVRGLIIMLLLEFLVLPSFAVMVRDFFEKFNFRVESYSAAYFLDNALSISTYIDFVSIVDPWNALCWFAIGYTLFFQVFEIISPNEKKKYEQQDGYGSHGTARWQSKNEIKKYYYNTDKEGWFLGHLKKDAYKLEGDFAYHTVNNSDKLNMQMNVIGPPGSNKTTGFVYPNIFEVVNNYKGSEEKPDLIITDPKSELLMYTANYLKDNGYDVRVLDFIHLKYGDQFNPFDFITEEKELMQIAEGFISAANSAKQKGKSSGSKDPIWDNGEALLVGALIGFILQTYPEEKQTFETLSKLLVSDDVKDPELAERFFKINGIDGAALDLWNKFLIIQDKMRTSIVGGLAIKLTLFSVEGIKRITEKTTIDIRQLGIKKKKPIALFILMPDSDQTFAPVINTTLAMIFKQLYKTAYLYKNKLQVPVYFILEEIANIGKIPDLEEMLGTMRGRRIYPMMIWQDLSQMKKLYGDVWEGMLGKCDTQVILGVNDDFSAEKISKSLGPTTIKTQGDSQKAGGLMTSPGKSLSQNHQGRSLLFPNEIRTFPNDEAIIIQRARNPVRLYKTQYQYWEKLICEPMELTEFKTFSEGKSVRKKAKPLINQVQNHDNPSLDNPNKTLEIQPLELNKEEYLETEILNDDLNKDILEAAAFVNKQIETDEVAASIEENEDEILQDLEVLNDDLNIETEVFEEINDIEDPFNDLKVSNDIFVEEEDEFVFDSEIDVDIEEDIFTSSSNEIDKLIQKK